MQCKTTRMFVLSPVDRLDRPSTSSLHADHGAAAGMACHGEGGRTGIEIESCSESVLRNRRLWFEIASLREATVAWGPAPTRQSAPTISPHHTVLAVGRRAACEVKEIAPPPKLVASATQTSSFSLPNSQWHPWALRPGNCPDRGADPHTILDYNVYMHCEGPLRD